MARPEKTLREHADDGTFRVTRHADLFATDETLFASLFADDDFYGLLAELCLLYRAEKMAQRRREIARAFAGYPNSHNDKAARKLMRDPVFGIDLTWERWRDTGEWVLVRCSRPQCRSRVIGKQRDLDEELTSTMTESVPTRAMLKAAQAAWEAA